MSLESKRQRYYVATKMLARTTTFVLVVSYMDQAEVIETADLHTVRHTCFSKSVLKRVLNS